MPHKRFLKQCTTSRSKLTANLQQVAPHKSALKSTTKPSCR